MKLGLDPKYVLDEISFYEIQALLKNQYYKEKEAWEQTRLLGFIIAKANGAKIKKAEDLMKFEWEIKEKAAPVFISEEKMEQYRNRAQAMIDNNFFE